MKCTLIRCPQTFGRFISAAYASPPIGLAYVAASVRKAGHEVDVVDTTGEAVDTFVPVDEQTLRRGLTDDQILDRIQSSEVIGFSLMFSQDWLVARELIARVRERFPDSVLVAGGEHFTAEPMGAMEDAPGLDFVVIGEGESVICDLLEHVAGHKPVEEVAGIYYRSNGSIVKSEAAPRIRNIDELPWPAWDLVSIENYLDGGHGWGVDRGRNMPMNATRGCPYQCTFCSNPTMWTTRWVSRSPSDVIAEIKLYMERYAATNFDFQDLTAIVRRDWILEFTRQLIEEDLNITWQLPSGTRSEALDEEVLRLLYASGCRNISYAPESGTEDTLRRIKKRIKRDRMVDSMRACVKTGCNVKANFIFGFPGDTYRSYLQTFGFLARIAVAGVHDISIAPFRPYPGSELFRDLQIRGDIPKELDDHYYHDLATTTEEGIPFFSKTQAKSYCENISPEGLNRLRLVGMAWFFGISWLLRPHRVLQALRALFTERQESRLDKSLIEMKRRIMRRWRGEPGLSAGRINPY